MRGLRSPGYSSKGSLYGPMAQLPSAASWFKVWGAIPFSAAYLGVEISVVDILGVQVDHSSGDVRS